MPRIYKTIQGDTWDLISFKLYRDLGGEGLCDKLISANTKYINYVIFPAGCELVIPDIEIPKVNTLPPWMS